MAPPRPRLNKDKILSAALEIIDERGVGACSMRAVATRLGVEAMSLYWHVPGKEALLDGVVEKMLTGAPDYVHRDDWRDELDGLAHATRELLLRHPNAIRLLVGRTLSSYSSARDVVEQALLILERDGFSRRDAVLAIRTVFRYVVGFSLLENSTRPLVAEDPARIESPAMSGLADSVKNDASEDLFEFGLRAMIDGLAAALERSLNERSIAQADSGGMTGAGGPVVPPQGPSS